MLICTETREFGQGLGWTCTEELVYGDKQHEWLPRGALHTQGPGVHRRAYCLALYVSLLAFSCSWATCKHLHTTEAVCQLAPLQRPTSAHSCSSHHDRPGKCHVKTCRSPDYISAADTCCWRAARQATATQAFGQSSGHRRQMEQGPARQKLSGARSGHPEDACCLWC